MSGVLLAKRQCVDVELVYGRTARDGKREGLTLDLDNHELPGGIGCRLDAPQSLRGQGAVGISRPCSDKDGCVIFRVTGRPP
jgi:hypothetical protein